MAGPSIVLPQAGDEVTAAWGQSVAGALNGMQAGIVQGSMTASTATDIVVTYPKPFVAGPVVVLGGVLGNTYLANLVSVPGATSFTIRFFKRDGTAMVAGTVLNVCWLAVGTLA